MSSTLVSGKRPRQLALGEGFTPIFHMPPNAKKTFSWRRYHVPSSAGQRRAQLALTQSSIGTRGQRGAFAGNLNAAAIAAIRNLSGRSQGGMSADQRRQIQYARADNTVRKLSQLVGGAAPTGPRGPEMGYPVQ